MLRQLNKILKNAPEYRKEQLLGELFNGLITDWSKAKSLPTDIRKSLTNKLPIYQPDKIIASKEGNTAKAVINFKSGDNAAVETVLMKHGDRNTVCVSSQLGCPAGCAFCLTGKMGFKRNLTGWEIINQILIWERYLQNSESSVTNIVFMGMGEPFLNYNNVISAAKELNNPQGLNIGARKISISTVGIPKKIIQFAQEKEQFNLAVSLHAPNNQLRSKLIPLNKNHPIEEVLDAVDQYIKITNRKVMLEYLLLDSVNDSTELAQELAELLTERLVMVNLISYNPTGEFQPSPEKKIAKFKSVLEEEGMEVTRRYKFGRDIKAACGQLSSSSSSP